ncbi:MAG TPA: hypothetical protein VF556_17675 [Pyrinomonadaceae bacterium]|jgi:uncharacterized membrane protein YeaQ/YmgE (transglycosylase-associated protein family)
MFTFIIGLILWIAGAVVSPIGIKKDADSSKDFQYHGLTEGNSKADDEHGFFAYKKNLILSYICMSVGIIAGFLAILLVKDKDVAGAVMIIGGGLAGGFGAMRWRQAIKNDEAKIRGREKQTQFLRALRDYQSFEKPENELPVMFNGQHFTTRNGRTYYKLFGYIYSENPDQSSAISELQAKLAALSLKPENEWFPK